MKPTFWIIGTTLANEETRVSGVTTHIGFDRDVAVALSTAAFYREHGRGFTLETVSVQSLSTEELREVLAKMESVEFVDQKDKAVVRPLFSAKAWREAGGAPGDEPYVKNETGGDNPASFMVPLGFASCAHDFARDTANPLSRTVKCRKCGDEWDMAPEPKP